jgi:hypothetical protein
VLVKPGPRGAKGDPGPAVTALSISGEAMLVITNADGSSVSLDLYPLLEQVQRPAIR